MTNHCWHETELSLSQSLSHSRAVICCNCGTTARREFEIALHTRLVGHGKHFGPQTLVPQIVECETECKDE